MTHQAAFSLALALAAGATTTLPDGHLDKINALQAQRGKAALSADQILARPIRLYGNKLTSYFTRSPDGDLRLLADQINASGGPLLSAHVLDNTPMGTFYAAAVVEGDFVPSPEPGDPQQELWLDTWMYVLNDDEGQRITGQIDAGIINEASIGFLYDQVICSITGGDYYNSPYYRGRTYTITDPSTGTSEEKLCFIWTTGNVEFSEGSLVYRGAYPGTKVGGDAASSGLLNAAAPSPISAPPIPTRFQLAASKDMQVAFEKAPARPGSGTPPTPPSAADTPGEQNVKLRLKLPDGSVKEIDATPQEAQTLLDEQISSAEARGQQTLLERHAAALGVEPKDVTEGSLKLIAAQAADGQQYRQDLLSRIGALTLSVGGNSEANAKAADRAQRAFANLPVTDIREEVERLEAALDATVPSARLSADKDDPETPRKVTPNLDAV